MRHLAAILALLLVLPPAPPPFSAVWQRGGIARLSWTQRAGVRETCVVRGIGDGGWGMGAAQSSVLIGCWYNLPAGPTNLTLGNAGPMDASFRPQAGDVFELAQDGVGERASLRGVVYLGVVRR